MSIDQRDLMGGLAKGLRIIEAFSPERPRLSIVQAAAAAALDRATARRCLLTLAQTGYASYDGKFFTLTPRVLRLGIGSLAAMPLPRIVQPVLDRLSEEIGESSSVSILDETEIVYVARAAQRRVMSVTLMPGSRLPAYCTSMGRVLLAALAPDEARRLLETSDRRQRTTYTVTDVDALMAALAIIRQEGFALIDQEVETGLRSIAIPIRNGRGQVVAALNIGLAANTEPVSALKERFLPVLEKIKTDLSGMLMTL